MKTKKINIRQLIREEIQSLLQKESLHMNQIYRTSSNIKSDSLLFLQKWTKAIEYISAGSTEYRWKHLLLKIFINLASGGITLSDLQQSEINNLQAITDSSTQDHRVKKFQARILHILPDEIVDILDKLSEESKKEEV